MNGSRDKRKYDRETSTEKLEKYFLNPIIHREIHEDKVYVPLDMSRIWSK